MTLSSLWSTLSNIGISESMDSYTKRNTILCNQINILVALLMLPFTLLGLFTWIGTTRESALYGVIGTFVSNVSMLLLSKAGFPIVARLLTVLMLTGIATAATTIGPLNIDPTQPIPFISYFNRAMSLCSCAGLPLLLFHVKKERLILFGLYTLYFALLFSLNTIDEYLGMSMNEREMIITQDTQPYVISTLGTLITIIGFYLFFTILNVRYEKKVSDKNDALIASEEELKQNIEELNQTQEHLSKQSDEIKKQNRDLQTMEEELRQNLEEIQAQRDFVEQANNKIKSRNETINRHSKILMGLSKHPYVQSGNWNIAVDHIINTIAQVLEVSRVSIWRVEGDKGYCEKAFDRDLVLYISGDELNPITDSKYLSVMHSEHSLLLYNVHQEEIAERLILDENITNATGAMLSVSYLVNGNFHGLIHIEHIGDSREWIPEDKAFMESMSDIVTVAYQNHQKAIANRFVRKSTELLSKMAKHEGLAQGNWDGFLEDFTFKCATHTHVSSVSVWEYTDGDSSDIHLKCLKSHERSSQDFSKDLLLSQKQFPAYFRMLNRQQPIVIDNVHDNTVSSEFSQSYFKVSDIVSLLHVPYFINGKLKGVVCCEQRGKVREWSVEDQLFMKSMANLITVSYQNLQQLEQQKALRHYNTELLNVQDELQANLSTLEATQTSLREQKDELSLQHKRTLESIQYAQTIQQAILPHEKVRHRLFPNSFVMFLPKDIVSGDFYWISEGPDGQRVVAVVDCTGHGVPGAFMSIIGYNLLSEIILRQGCYEPAEILEYLDTGVIKALKQKEGSNGDGMDVNICVLEDQGRDQVSVKFSGAKNSLMYTERGELRVCKGSRRSVGGYYASRTHKAFDTHEILLSSNEMIYLTSDGLQDQNNVQRQKLSSRRLKALMRSLHPLAVAEQKAYFERELRNHMKGTPQRDDITLIGIKL